MGVKVESFIYKDDDDLCANTYLVSLNNKCVVIDPSKANEGLISYIKKHDLELKGILLTHGHFDHMRGVDILIESFNCPLYIGFYDEPKLLDPFLNCSSFAGESSLLIHHKAETIADNDILKLLDEDIICLETPYHTSGSISYYFKDSKILFSGDFLFKNSIGRDDLPTACPKKLDSSLSKIFILPDDVKIYPGHGGFTTVGNEKHYNPFVKR